MHSITGRLSRTARTHVSDKGTTFFVSLGEKNYDYKNKTTVWTNYEAALFAKDNQVQYYTDVLVEGAIVSVGGSGIIPEDEGQYGIKLILQNASLEYAHNEARLQQTHNSGMSQVNSQLQDQSAPQQNNQQQNTPPPQNQSAGMDDFDDDLPF